MEPGTFYTPNHVLVFARSRTHMTCT